MGKIEDDLVVYTVIEPMGNGNGQYKLDALLCKDGSYTMPSFDFHGKEPWDSVSYLKQLLEALRNWNIKVIRPVDIQLLEEIRNEIPEEDFEDILLMFEKADKLGFFNEN